jgi:hypothetical protein
VTGEGAVLRTAAWLCAFGAIAGAVPASAQSSTAARDYSVLGDVPQLCAVASPTLSPDHPPVNFTGLTGTTLGIDRLTDPTTLSTNAASVEVGVSAICNYPHTITIQSQNNGLWRDIAAPAPPGFGDAVPYTATLVWGSVSQTFAADASSRGEHDLGVAVDRPTQGQILLRLDILPGASNAQSAAPLLAGIYRDTIRITVGPQ